MMSKTVIFFYRLCMSFMSPIFWFPNDHVVTALVDLWTQATLDQSRSRVVSAVKSDEETNG